MILSNNYFYYDKVIPEKFCDDIVKTGKQFYESKLGVTGDIGSKYPDIENNKKVVNKLVKVRHSTVRWLQENWIYRALFPIINEANKLANWNFQWDYAEQAQFTEYGINQHYDWHCDAWAEPYGEDQKDKTLVGKVRKLSVTVSLSNPYEYEGGELEFDFRNTKPNKKTNFRSCTEIKEKGSLVVFPSFVWHRVKPVTKGIRHSLVIWVLGESFK